MLPDTVRKAPGPAHPAPGPGARRGPRWGWGLGPCGQRWGEAEPGQEKAQSKGERPLSPPAMPGWPPLRLSLKKEKC